MDRLRLVLVGTEGAVNMGLIARLVKNFDVDEFYLVSPVASIEEARRYAAKAADVLDRAVIVGSLGEALAGASYSICTSAISRSDDPLRSPVDPEYAVKAASSVDGIVALVMGRESVGLTRRELGMCNIMSSIPSSSSYPELNLSNATAIYLYEFYKARSARREVSVDKGLLDIVEKYVDALVEDLVRGEEKRREVSTALKRISSKSVVSPAEVKSLAFLLSRIYRRLERCRRSGYS
ncbi:MAG: rRNA methyltransferase [Desulfurococcales archaeon]|nr:rRNA methyltransferase [Desulfurococcales archaeon]